MRVQYNLNGRVSDYNTGIVRNILINQGIRTGVWTYGRSDELEKQIKAGNIDRESYDIIIVSDIIDDIVKWTIMGALISLSWQPVTVEVI